MSNFTLGSLFDGSGGFPLGGLLCGIKPLWASEVEPFPIRVTTKRLPEMKHLGDINKIDGAAVPPVDIITGGFCCQDLSVAGKRAGLHGERSGLFFQIIRIIKEMREATANEYPRFAVLENVPGMYSSHGGADFLEVLNELVKIKNETLSVPMPKSGKWSTSGEIVGDGFSVGWRTLDAQFFGVAQRRRRCFIVVDFTGERAGQILFDESRLRGNSPQSSTARQTTAGDFENCIGNTGPESIIAFEPGACSRLGGHCWNSEAVGALRADMGDNQTAVVIENHPADTRVKLNENGVVQTLSERMGTGGGNVPMICEPKALKIRSGCEGGGKGALIQDNLSATLSTSNDQTIFVPTAYGISSYESNAMKSPNPVAGIYEADTARTLDANGGNPGCNQGGIAICFEGNGARPSHRGSGVNEQDISFTLNATEQHGVAYAMTAGCYTQVCENQSPTLQARDYKDAHIVARPQYVVRRLTPIECAMLQGFPPDWCAGLETPEPSESDIEFWSAIWETHRHIIGTSSKPKSRNQIVKWLRNPHSDAAEYKMWGNGVALPCVVFILGGICNAQ